MDNLVAQNFTQQNRRMGLLGTNESLWEKGSALPDASDLRVNVRFNEHFHKRLSKTIVEPLICDMIEYLSGLWVIDCHILRSLNLCPRGQIGSCMLLELSAEKAPPLLRSAPSLPAHGQKLG